MHHPRHVTYLQRATFLRIQHRFPIAESGSFTSNCSTFCNLLPASLRCSNSRCRHSEIFQLLSNVVAQLATKNNLINKDCAALVGSCTVLSCEPTHIKMEYHASFKSHVRPARTLGFARATAFAVGSIPNSCPSIRARRRPSKLRAHALANVVHKPASPKTKTQRGTPSRRSKTLPKLECFRLNRKQC